MKGEKARLNVNPSQLSELPPQKLSHRGAPELFQTVAQPANHSPDLPIPGLQERLFDCVTVLDAERRLAT